MPYSTLQICNSCRFIDKVAIITAATDGIGLAIAERLAQEGAKIVISSRREANVIAAVTHLKNNGIAASSIASCVCHVAQANDRRRLVDAAIVNFGRIDVLVNNAGINPLTGDILEVDDVAWDKLFDVNVKAAFQLTKLVVPYMEKNGGGSIVFNASIAGYLTPHLRQEDDNPTETFTNPMKRYGGVEECASVVAFLASDDASYITGESIVVAGGEYSRL